jgi:lysophospholipase L1-like esterase
MSIGVFGLARAFSTTYNLNPADNLQAAIDKANPGDTILLPEGYLWTGNLILPVKPSVLGEDGNPLWITVRSTLNLPAGRKVQSRQPQAAIVSSNALPAISNDYANPDAARRAAHHFVFDGISVSRIYLAAGFNARSQSLPHDISFRHIDLQGGPAPTNPAAPSQGEIGRGLVLAGPNVTFTDSYVDDWHSKTIVIGDSQAGGFAPDEPFPQLPPNWFSQIVVKSGSTIRYLANAGVLADTTDHMLARLQSDVISLRPDKVFIVAGYTDVGWLTPPKTIVGNIAAMIVQLKAANIAPILCTLPPSLPISNLGVTTDAITVELNTVNTMIAKLAASQGIPLVDFYSVLADPVTGLYKDGYSSDGFHPQMPATRVMAEAALAATANLYDPVSPWLPSTDPDGINLIADPLFLQNPSQWTATLENGAIPMQVSSGSEPSITGNAITLTNIDPGSASILSGATLTSGFKPGDRLALSGRIKSTGCELGLMQFSVGVNFTNVGYGVKKARDNTHTIFRWPVDIQNGQFYMEFVVQPPVDPTQPVTLTPVIELNSGLTQCDGCGPASNGMLTGGAGAVGGVGTVTIGQFGLINLTALGLTP